MPTFLTPDCLNALQPLMPRADMRGALREKMLPASEFLPRSHEAGLTLAAALESAPTARARSEVEVQLLAAAAVDLTLADHLSSSPETLAMRGAPAVDPAIWQGLTQPEQLLRPTVRPVRYRGADRDLLATVNQVLNSILESTTETTADAITAALTLNAAILRDALKLAGMDIKQLLEDLGAGEIASFVVEFWQKMSFLLGPENVDLIQNTVAESIEKLREKTAVAHYVRQFLDTEAIYQEGRQLLQVYQGPSSQLAELTPQILALQGSFAGRNKLVASLTRLLSLAKLSPPLRTPPWGPLIVVSGYLLIIGYELYSAHDHVDSDRYPFFDRVAGVRTQLATLNWPH